MNIPTIFDWIARFDHLRGEPAVLILLVTAALIALFWDWRLALFALMVQYLVVALLFVDLLDPRLAIIKLLAGMFVCLILYWTARQVDYGRLPGGLSPTEAARIKQEHKKIPLGPWTFSRQIVVRTGTVALGLVALLIITRQSALTLPGMPDELPYINQAVLILMGMGLIGVVLSHHPLPAGMVLFTFLTGFELYYAALEQSVAMLVALAALNFTLALAVAYLSQARLASWLKLLND